MGDISEEKESWLILTEMSLKKIWNNKKDDKIWNKYLKDETKRKINSRKKRV